MSFLSKILERNDAHVVAGQMGLRVVEVEGAPFEVAAGAGIIFIRDYPEPGLRSWLIWEGIAICMLEQCGQHWGSQAATELAVRLSRVSGLVG
jgi:hypothetical protein